MKTPLIASGLMFAGMILLGAGSTDAAVLPISPSTTPPAHLEQVHKIFGLEGKSALGRHHPDF